MRVSRPREFPPSDRRGNIGKQVERDRGFASRVVLYSILLFASFAHNALCIPDGVMCYSFEPRVGYCGPDSDLVLNRMELARQGAPWWYPLFWWDESGGRWYRSQFGLQGIVCSAAANCFQGTPVSMAS